MREPTDLNSSLPNETLSPISHVRLDQYRKRREKLYFGGSISLEWWIQAGQQPGKAIHMAVAIAWLRIVKRQETFPLQNFPWVEFGFDTTTAYRALRALETAKLISLDRKRGRHPLVTILDDLEGNPLMANTSNPTSLTGEAL